MDKLNKWFSNKIQRIGLWQFALIKTTLILFGIIIGSLISGFVINYMWYFLGIFLVLYIWVIIIFFKKDKLVKKVVKKKK